MVRPEFAAINSSASAFAASPEEPSVKSTSWPAATSARTMAAPTPLPPPVTRMRVISLSPLRLCPEDEAGILAAEAEGIREHVVHLRVAGDIGHHIERDRRIGHLV